jgi:hypothetical protein
MASFAIIALSLIVFVVVACAIALVFIQPPSDAEPGENP